MSLSPTAHLTDDIVHFNLGASDPWDEEDDDGGYPEVIFHKVSEMCVITADTYTFILYIATYYTFLLIIHFYWVCMPFLLLWSKLLRAIFGIKFSQTLHMISFMLCCSNIYYFLQKQFKSTHFSSENPKIDTGKNWQGQKFVLIFKFMAELFFVYFLPLVSCFYRVYYCRSLVLILCMRR